MLVRSATILVLFAFAAGCGGKAGVDHDPSPSQESSPPPPPGASTTNPPDAHHPDDTSLVYAAGSELKIADAAETRTVAKFDWSKDWANGAITFAVSPAGSIAAVATMNEEWGINSPAKSAHWEAIVVDVAGHVRWQGRRASSSASSPAFVGNDTFAFSVGDLGDDSSGATVLSTVMKWNVLAIAGGKEVWLADYAMANLPATDGLVPVSAYAPTKPFPPFLWSPHAGTLSAVAVAPAVTLTPPPIVPPEGLATVTVQGCYEGSHENRPQTLPDGTTFDTFTNGSAVGLFRSTDGAHWTQLGPWFEPTAALQATPVGASYFVAVRVGCSNILGSFSAPKTTLASRASGFVVFADGHAVELPHPYAALRDLAFVDDVTRAVYTYVDESRAQSIEVFDLTQRTVRVLETTSAADAEPLYHSAPAWVYRKTIAIRD